MKSHNLFRAKEFFILLLMLALLPTIFLITPSQAQTLAPGGSGTDAIAIRIVPNPSQYSIGRWYAEQNFGGSPQYMQVDGYDAIRDNRTVYIAATNVVFPACGGISLPPISISKNKTENFSLIKEAEAAIITAPLLCPSAQIYFNIYIITYNEGADTRTNDVFGKILSNWKFNTNLQDVPNTTPTCSVPERDCAVDADCPGGFICDNYTNNPTSPTYRCQSETKCSIDSDCPSGSYCNSSKAALLRNVKRLSALKDIKRGVENYRFTHNRYPTLISGTYLPQAAISTWPSWQNTFLTQIGLSNIYDPINKLGPCAEKEAFTPADVLSGSLTINIATTSEPGFDPKTCWNATTKKYYLEGLANDFQLPADSYAMAYNSDVNGSNYDLCVNMEPIYDFRFHSKRTFSVMTLEGAQTDLSSNNCRTTAVAGFTGSYNNPPSIVAANLVGQPGTQFVGFIKASDPEGNPLSFDITSYGTNYSSGGWSAVPVLQNTSDPNQKKVWAQTAGLPGNYTFNLEVTDSNGLSTSSLMKINIVGPAPVLNVSDIEYDLTADPGQPLNYDLYFEDYDFNSLDLSFALSVAKKDGFWQNLVKGFKILSNNFIIKKVLAQREVGGTLIIAPPSGTGGIIGRPPGAIVPVPICPSLSGNGTISTPWRFSPSMVNCTYNINNGLKAKLFKEAEGKYRFNLSGIISPLNFTKDSNLDYKVTVRSNSGQTVSKDFRIKLKANPPQIDFACNKKASLYENYTCKVNNLNTSNALTEYTFISLPPGLSGNSEGLISGTPLKIGQNNVSVRAQNEYGAKSQTDFELTVESTCGKSLVKYPGGPWNVLGDIKNQGGYYKTVLIGSQCWLADNLNIANYSLPAIAQEHLQINKAGEEEKDNWFKRLIKSAKAQLNIESYAVTQIGKCYNDNDVYCQAEGRLYNWNEAMAADSVPGTKGLCPEGWHVPTDEEYKILEMNVGMCTNDQALQMLNNNLNGVLYDGENRSLLLGGEEGGETLKSLSGGEYTAPIESRSASLSPEIISGKTSESKLLIDEGSRKTGETELINFNNFKDWLQKVLFKAALAQISEGITCGADLDVAVTGWNRGVGMAPKLKVNGDSGFGALLSGWYDQGEANPYKERNGKTYFWTSDSFTNAMAWARGLQSADGIYRGSDDKQNRYSLRCIQNRPCIPPCEANSTCRNTGECSPCSPSCVGVCGGDDGCGGTCPDLCIAPNTCNTSDPPFCQCLPNCAGKNCGPDGCGGSCGTCAPLQVCNSGVCGTAIIGGGSLGGLEINCTPNCVGKNCGSDGCGGSCGTCSALQTCTNGVCVTNLIGGETR